MRGHSVSGTVGQISWLRLATLVRSISFRTPRFSIHLTKITDDIGGLSDVMMAVAELLISASGPQNVSTAARASTLFQVRSESEAELRIVPLFLCLFRRSLP